MIADQNTFNVQRLLIAIKRARRRPFQSQQVRWQMGQVALRASQRSMQAQ